MWIGLLWILGCYGISIAVLHLWFGARKGRNKKPAKVLLVTKITKIKLNGIFARYFFSGLKGYEVTATIYDEGSSDDTRQIIERLSHTHLLDLRYQMDFDTVDQFMSQHEGEPVVVVHLSNREDLVKIPVG